MASTQENSSLIGLARSISVGVILCTLTALLIGSMYYKSDTRDEGKHYKFGERVLTGKIERAHIGEMPGMAIYPLVDQLFDYTFMEPVLEPLKGVTPARLFAVLLTVVLGLLIFHWSEQLYGTASGLFSLSIFALAPTVLGHGKLITPDLPSALLVTGTFYALWRWSTTTQVTTFAFFTFLISLAQCVKHSCILLFPISIILIVYTFFRKSELRSFGQFFRITFLLVTVPIITINALYLLDGDFVPLSEVGFQSVFMQEFIEAAGISDWTLPLSSDFLYGLDQVKWVSENGHSYGKIVLLGERMQGGGSGFENYFPIAISYKFPLAILAIFALTTIALFTELIRGTFDSENMTLILQRNELYLLFPAVAYFFYFHFYNGAQIGVRYLLIFLPLVYILAGSLIPVLTTILKQSRFTYAIPASLIALLALDTLSHYPHYIAYFNSRVSGPLESYTILADSNSDWNQGRFLLDQFLRQHPDVTFNPYEDTSGTGIVAISDLLGITAPEERFAWLRDYHEPIDHLAHCYLIYDLQNH